MSRTCSNTAIWWSNPTWTNQPSNCGASSLPPPGEKPGGGGSARKRAEPEGDARPVRNVHHSFTIPLRGRSLYRRHLAAESFGETGATVSSGPRVGSNTLSEILCTGKIRVIVTDGDQPVSYSDLGEAIPPHIRSFVHWRDQGQCSIEGCRSRYRLQPHHTRERQHHGTHDPDNLTTLCWYHHHIAIHQLGFQIDPASPTHRRRLIGPKTTTGPPA